MKNIFLKHFRVIRAINVILLMTFVFSMTLSPVSAQVLNLPAPGTLLRSSASFQPAMIHGVMVDPVDPLKFNFIVDKGETNFEGDEFGEEANRLVKYFMAAMTVPQNQMWVNLSPYEQNRIIPETFGQTEMGRDLLAQDYILKQLASSLSNPEDDLGHKFWERVYARAKEKFGTTDVPADMFNKIWIVPATAEIYEYEKGSFITSSHLNVMLEKDYLAMEANHDSKMHGLGGISESNLPGMDQLTEDILREVLVPEIEREVNEGKTFANLRQIYHSMLLAKWYKERLKESLLGQVYADQGKTDGVNVDDPQINQKIYQQYVEAFEKGVYNMVKEEYDPIAQQLIPRKYFSGGMAVDRAQFTTVNSRDVQKVMNEFTDPVLVTTVVGDSASITASPIEGKNGIKDIVDYWKRIQDWENPLGEEIRGNYNKDWVDEEGRIKPGLVKLITEWIVSQPELREVYNSRLLDEETLVGDVRSGAYGKVYFTEGTERYVKVSEFPPKQESGSQSLEILKGNFDEVFVLLKLKEQGFQNVPEVEEIGLTTEGKLYMRFKGKRDTKTLADMIQSDEMTQEKMEDVFKQLTAILKRLHALGWVHADIKPGNIVVTPDNQVMLIDFGLTLPLGADYYSQKGTPFFTLPKKGPAVASIDWYALEQTVRILFSPIVDPIELERVMGQVEYSEWRNWNQNKRGALRNGDDLMEEMSQAGIIRKPFSRFEYYEVDSRGVFGKDFRRLPRFIQDYLNKLNDQMLSYDVSEIYRIINAANEKKDSAMQVADEIDMNNKGGIDLNPSMVQMQTSGVEVVFPVPTPEMVERFRSIQRFNPAVLDITPTSTPQLQMLLGLSDQRGDRVGMAVSSG